MKLATPIWRASPSRFARAKAGTASEEATAYAAQVSGDISQQERTKLIATRTDQQAALDEFALIASVAQRRLVQDMGSADALSTADQLADQLGNGGTFDPAGIAKAYGAVVDLMYKAEQQLARQAIAIERHLFVFRSVVEPNIASLGRNRLTGGVEQHDFDPSSLFVL